jgi:uncharacterized protein DUF6752
VALKDIVKRTRARRDLPQRVADLEADVLELRRHNLRLAEIVDVVTELVVPLSSRDQDKIDAAIEKFNESL